MTADEATKSKGAELLRLHQHPTLLSLVNVWDVVSARTVAAVDGTRALATASHSIAASFGYEDGENIPLDLMLEQVKRIVDATDLPVTADLEAGYGDAAETVRRAIGLGVVGANIEDQMKPLAEAVSAVAAVMRAAEAEGVPDFVLNARTDAFLHGADRDPHDVLADAVERGRAFLDAGAPVVFVPGRVSDEQVVTLVDAFGRQRLSLLPVPGGPSLSRLARLRGAAVRFLAVAARAARRGAVQLRAVPAARGVDRTAADGRGRGAGRGDPGGHAP